MQFEKNEIASHPFIQKLMDNNRPNLEAVVSLLKDAAREGKFRSKVNPILCEHEWYDHDVFTHVAPIISGIERLEQSQNFIRTFPRPHSYEKEGINRHIWIEYHYSYYVITLVSLFDIALILTNSVFRLGNRERDCKPDLIMKNNWVRKTPVTQVLADLRQLIKPHQEVRNLYVHRGKEANIASAMNSDQLDILDLLSFIQMHAEPIIDREIIDYAYQGHVKEICERLQEERRKIHDVIFQLFNNLLLVYDKNATMLNEKWRGICDNELKSRMQQKG